MPVQFDHYCRECPMLLNCEYCEQVVEISELNAHLLDEVIANRPIN